MEKLKAHFKNFNQDHLIICKGPLISSRARFSRSSQRMNQTETKMQDASTNVNLKRTRRRQRSESCLKGSPEKTSQLYLFSSRNGICNLVDMSMRRPKSRSMGKDEPSSVSKNICEKSSYMLRDKWCHVSLFSFDNIPTVKKRGAIKDLLNYSNQYKTRRFKFR